MAGASVCLALFVAALLLVDGANSQLVQCDLCPCTRLTNQATSGPVDLLLTRSRNSPVSLTQVATDELYRVRLQARAPFQDFHLCSIGQSKTTHASFPSRYLPLQARLVATCDNVVTSGPKFKRKPGSVGELQFLWKSPMEPGQCVALSTCVQLSSGTNTEKWVHRSVTICTSTAGTGTGAPQPPPVTTPRRPRPVDPPTRQPPPPPVQTQPPRPTVQTRPPPPIRTQPPPPVATPRQPPPSNPFEPLNPAFQAFPTAAAFGAATVANVPSRGVRMTFPGPTQNQGITISLGEETSGTSTVMYIADTFYQISATSAQPFKRCYLMVNSQPNYPGQLPGDVVGKMRSGGEQRVQGYSNLVDCSAGQGLTTTSTAVFWKAPRETPCVEISVWLEQTDGVLQRADASFCKISYATNVGSCPSSQLPTETCSSCGPRGSLYFLHTGPRPSCCNGLPLGPDQQCCGGTIQPGTLAKGWLCCGNNTTFNPEEATCCRGNKQLGRASDVFCCESKSFSPSSVLSRSREARCCGSEAFDPVDKLCCGGSVHSTWPGVLGTQMACCPWDGLPFNPSTHNCMLCRGSPVRIIQPKSVPLNCCGTKPYNQTEKVCCDFNRELLVAAPYTRSGCCGGQVFDRDTSMCCLGQVARAPAGQQVNPNWRCCDTQAFDPATHECLECSGFRRLVRIDDAYSCCGITPFSRLSKLCCNGRVLELGRTYSSLGVLPQFACCGSRAFDPATQTCCSLSESSVVDRRGTSCCGSRSVYNTVLGERCIQCIGGQPQVLTATDQRICCGSELYDPLASACCINPLRVVTPDVTRPKSLTPRLFCCRGVAYDANLEKCCPNTNSIIDASAQC